MSTAIMIAKSMVRKAREVSDNRFVCKICDTIEFLVLMTLPFALPFLFLLYSPWDILILTQISEESSGFLKILQIN